MKYNEQELKKLFSEEMSIWKNDDLDWFDDELVEKLQTNQLPKQEKQKLIEMMANDQMVMDKYLSLKEETAESKSSLLSIFKHKLVPVFAVACTLVIAVAILLNQSNHLTIIDSDTLRGISKVAVHPLDNSILETAPDFFIIQNNNAKELQVSIIYKNKPLYTSGFQRSNKFYLPLNIKQSLVKGKYSWIVINKDNTTNEQHTFSIQ